MSRKDVGQLRPFLSLVLIIGTLFVLAFLQMESRRLGYVVLKQSREFKTMQDRMRAKSVQFARVTRPERVRDLAMHRLTMTDAKKGQIIHMAGERIAVRAN